MLSGASNNSTKVTTKLAPAEPQEDVPEEDAMSKEYKDMLNNTLLPTVLPLPTFQPYSSKHRFNLGKIRKHLNCCFPEGSSGRNTETISLKSMSSFKESRKGSDTSIRNNSLLRMRSFSGTDISTKSEFSNLKDSSANSTPIRKQQQSGKKKKAKKSRKHIQHPPEKIQITDADKNVIEINVNSQINEKRKFSLSKEVFKRKVQRGSPDSHASTNLDDFELPNSLPYSRKDRNSLDDIMSDSKMSPARRTPSGRSGRSVTSNDSGSYESKSLLSSKENSQNRNLESSPIAVGQTACSIKRQKCKQTRNIHAEKKAMKVLGVIFFTFVFMWTPFFVINMIMGVCTSCQSSISPSTINAVTWLGYTSSMVNPIFYTIFNKAFRETFKNIILCKFNQQKRRSFTQSGKFVGTIRY